MMRSIVLLVVILLVSSCAKPPTSIVLSPTLLPQKPLAMTNGTIDLQVIDNRNYRHILQLHNDGEKQNLISASQLPNQLVSETLGWRLKQQGYQLSPTAKTRMIIEINQMLITLNQQTLKYNADNNIVLTVIVSIDSEKMTKRFSTKGQSYGPLTADIAVLERIFNQQLGELITKVANDPQIRQSLTQFITAEK